MRGRERKRGRYYDEFVKELILGWNSLYVIIQRIEGKVPCVLYCEKKK